MKIGLIADDTLDKTDGVQQYVLALGKWFVAQDHEVHFLVGESRRTDVQNVHSLSKNVAVRFNGNRLTIPLPASKSAIKKLLAAQKFDVLHVQMPHSPFLAQRVIMAAPKATAIIGTFHILPHTRTAAHLNRLLGLWLRPSLRRIDRVLAVSDAAKVFADKSFRITSQVVPNTIDLSPFFGAKPFPEHAKRPTIVYLNRLEVRKGANYLVAAIEHLVHTLQYDKPFHVLICGKGVLAPKLAEYITRYNLTNYVTLTGFVPEADKPRYLASADIAVYPSTGGESFGIVLLEALAASPGVVLGGNNPGYASVLRPFDDQLFDPRDVPEFAHVLRRFLDDPTARHSRAARQQKYAHDFDVPVVASRIMKIYRETLRSKQNMQ